MENLCARGFDMWPKEKTISLDHALLMVDALGKFHGVSFAFKDQRPAEFSAFKSTTDLFGPVMANGMLKPLIEELFAWFGEAVSCAAHKQYLRSFDFLRSLDDVFEYGACDKFGVMSHGDCWTNNFMFEYGDAGVSTIVRGGCVTSIRCVMSTAHFLCIVLCVSREYKQFVCFQFHRQLT